jgi:hypothetical protein
MSQRTDDSGRSVTLVEKNGRFFFFQPDVGVIASDESIENAYQKFLGARHEFWREIEQAGLSVGNSRGAPGAHEIVLSPTGRSVPSELGLFVAKFSLAMILIAAIGGVVVTRAASGIAAAIDQVTGPARSISIADVSRKAADIVKDLRSLTESEKESLRQSIGAISREIDPIVDAWRNPPAKP